MSPDGATRFDRLSMGAPVTPGLARAVDEAVRHCFREQRRLVAGLRTEDGIATCAITELAFVRAIPQLPGISVDFAQAKELLRRLKGQRRLRIELLADALGADALPAWVRTTKQTTDGHLAALAKTHAAIFATLDGKIPGTFNVPP